MTAQEFKEAFALADSDYESFAPADINIFDGSALPGFQPVVATIQQVAHWIHYQARMLNGDWDAEELTSLRYICRHRVTMVGNRA